MNEVRRKYAERIRATLEDGTSSIGDSISTSISSVVGSSGTCRNSDSYIDTYSRGQGQYGQTGQDQWEETDLEDDDDLPF